MLNYKVTGFFFFKNCIFFTWGNVFWQISSSKDSKSFVWKQLQHNFILFKMSSLFFCVCCKQRNILVFWGLELNIFCRKKIVFTNISAFNQWLPFYFTGYTIAFFNIFGIPPTWGIFFTSSFQVFGPFLHLTAVIVMTGLSWLLIRQYFRLMTKSKSRLPFLTLIIHDDF